MALTWLRISKHIKIKNNNGRPKLTNDNSILINLVTQLASPNLLLSWFSSAPCRYKAQWLDLKQTSNTFNTTTQNTINKNISFYFYLSLCMTCIQSRWNICLTIWFGHFINTCKKRTCKLYSTVISFIWSS